MQLYTGSEPIDWVYHGKKTVEEMTGDHRFPQPGTAAVLYDDGAGKVFDWIFLDALATRYGVEVTESQATYEAIIEAMNKPLPAVTAEELQKVSDTATAAQNVAKKAQEQAEQAAAGSNPELATFAAIQLMDIAPTMSDADVLSIPSLFPEWKTGSEYEAKQVIRYGGELYRIAQKHTAQDQWRPGATGTESLYTHITQSGGYDVWKQPTGGHDAYDKGVKVWYPTANSTLYESLIEGNTTIPGSDERWWKVVTE